MLGFKKLRFISAAITLLSLVHGASASLSATLSVPVGVQFSNGDSLAATQTAGVIPQANFNVVTVGYEAGSTGTTGALMDANGNGTAVTLTHSSSDGFRTSTSTGTPNGTLLHDEDKTGPVNGTRSIPGLTATYEFNNVPSGVYDLIAYIECNNTENANITVGSTTYYVTDQGAVSGTPAFLSADNTVASSRVTGNYVEFFDVSPSLGSLTLTNTAEGGVDGSAPINGLQLVPASVPEPSSIGVVGLIATWVIAGRRKRR